MRRSVRLFLPLVGLLAACAGLPPSAPTPTSVPTATPTVTPVPTPVPSATPTATPTSLMLVTLGDSLTYGDQDDPPGGGWPSRLQSLLHSRRPSSQVNNLARPGWTAHDLLHGRDGEPNQIDRAVELLREAPGEKIATVWIGVNDLFYLYAWGDPTESEEALALNRFKRDLGEVVQRLLDTGARVFLARLHDPAQEPARQHEALLGIAPDEWTRLTRLAEEFNAVIASIAASYQQPVVDIPASQVFSTAQWMHPDGIHPNARGYDELARVWLMALLAAPAP